MLASFAAVVLFCATANNPPNTPTITEPAFDGRVVNPEDVHMETAPFSDPDAGDTHAATDWEIWLADDPQQVVWAALNITGIEKVHIHLGNGIFQGAFDGRTSLLPNTNYFLRARHKDSSGDPNTQWSPYAIRYFSTGDLSTVFPLQLDDVASSPLPTWVDGTSTPALLPAGAQPATLRIESAIGETLLQLSGGVGQNQITNPATLPAHVNIRVTIAAGGQSLALPATDLTVTDSAGVDRTIFLPAISLSASQSVYLWVSSNGSTYYGQPSQTQPVFTSLARGNGVPWSAQPGFKIEVVASGFKLPINIAFVPNAGSQPDSPYFYVIELYGTIKCVHRDYSITTYATDLLNFQPDGAFPGSGEQGLSGCAVDPATGDLFVAMLYDSAPPDGPHYPKVIRLHSTDGGRTMASQSLVLDMPGEEQGESHFISNVSIGPDGKLYVHMGDGFFTETSQDLTSFRGKILRLNLNGTAPSDNPFYNASNGISATDYIYALGFRNPFGGAWRAADNKHYEVENGPAIDRFAQVSPGQNFGFDGTDDSMRIGALYNWIPAGAPVNITFVEPTRFGGSGFPATSMGHAFVTESGPTYATGPQVYGKRIGEYTLNAAGGLVGAPFPLAEYNGSGHATCVGLAAGPDGLYFSDFYLDQGAIEPGDPGANILRIRFVGAADFTADATLGPAPLTVHFTDRSTVPSPTGRSWDFGDGTTDTSLNPTHVYAQNGVYTVRLTVTGAEGPTVLARAHYVKVGQTPTIAVIGGSLPLSSADQAVASHLTSLGYSVQTYGDLPPQRPSAQTLAAANDVVMITSTVNPANIAGEFRTANVPLVFWNSDLLQLGWEAMSEGGGQIGGQSDITITDATHPIMRGQTAGDLTVYQPASSVSYVLGDRGFDTDVLAVRSDTQDPLVMVADQGGVMLRQYVTPARRAFLFFGDSSYLQANAQARQILDQAACWAGLFDPGVSAPPVPLIAIGGANAVFTVGATGGAPLSYHWRKNGVFLSNGGRISGATSATLTISAAISTDAGDYSCDVSNRCAVTTSPAAHLTVTSCYANCDNSTTQPILNVLDFSCFLNKFAAGDPYANCDNSTTPPVLNVVDFSCFLNKFAVGCP